MKASLSTDFACMKKPSRPPTTEIPATTARAGEEMSFSSMATFYPLEAYPFDGKVAVVKTASSVYFILTLIYDIVELLLHCDNILISKLWSLDIQCLRVAEFIS